MHFQKNLHLLLSTLIIIPVAIAYGCNIFSVLDNFLLLPPRSIDFSNMLKAIMGLYIGMAFFWIMGIIKPALWYGATISNILFMGGLALGRCMSLILDGKPSLLFVIGLMGELILAVTGIFYLQKFKNHANKNVQL